MIDVGLPSVCGEYHWLINSLGAEQEIEVGGEKKLNAGRKEVESERNHGATAIERHAETLLVGHDLVVMHRLMEMG